MDNPIDPSLTSPVSGSGGNNDTKSSVPPTPAPPPPVSPSPDLPDVPDLPISDLPDTPPSVPPPPSSPDLPDLPDSPDLPGSAGTPPPPTPKTPPPPPPLSHLPDPIPVGPDQTPPPAKPKLPLKTVGIVAAVLFLLVTTGLTATLLIKQQQGGGKPEQAPATIEANPTPPRCDDECSGQPYIECAWCTSKTQCNNSPGYHFTPSCYCSYCELGNDAQNGCCTVGPTAPPDELYWCSDGGNGHVILHNDSGSDKAFQWGMNPNCEYTPACNSLCPVNTSQYSTTVPAYSTATIGQDPNCAHLQIDVLKPDGNGVLCGYSWCHWDSSCEPTGTPVPTETPVNTPTPTETPVNTPTPTPTPMIGCWDACNMIDDQCEEVGLDCRCPPGQGCGEDGICVNPSCPNEPEESDCVCSPTNTPTPPPAGELVCRDLNYSSPSEETNPYYDEDITLTCVTNGDKVSRMRFRYQLNNGSWVDNVIPDATTIVGAATGTWSGTTVFNFYQSGIIEKDPTQSYLVTIQCQGCIADTGTDACSAWPCPPEATPTPDQIAICEAGGGVWNEKLPTSCADRCIQEDCQDVVTPGCDCQEAKCWDEASQACIPDSSDITDSNRY